MNERRHLLKYGWLSVAAALVTIGLKMSAYLLTGSVGLLSDALESLVNLVAAVLALLVLSVAARPPDEEHAYGHDKAEYFSSGVEGALIVIAAVTILASAVGRLLQPQPLMQLNLGLAITLLAAVINLVVALVLRRAGRRFDSVTLEANAQHLLTDVWTSAGVVVGVGAVMVTGWQPLDAIVAIVVALQIIVAGIRLVTEAVHGLMDTALCVTELAQIEATLDRYARSNVEISYHALRTRRSGSRRFISVHLQVPGAWSVQKGHTLVEEIERDLREVLSPVSVLVHLEPIEDPVSWQDIELHRET